MEEKGLTQNEASGCSQESLTKQLEFHQLEMRYEAMRRTSPERERGLVASLAQNGQQVPVVVVASAEAERYVVVDGYKRIRGLKRLHQDTVVSTVWALEEAEALILERLMHGQQSCSALEQGWLLQELNQRFGFLTEELARRFDRSPSWVSRRLNLVRELPEAIQQGVLRGEIQPHAAMKYLIPLARANLSDCMSIVEGVKSRRLTTRQMGKLYRAYVCGTEQTRELVLQSPLVFLKADEEVRRELPVEASPFEGLKTDLNLLASVCRRVVNRFRKGLGVQLRSGEREQARRLYLQAQAEFETLARRCDKEVLDARSQHANGDPETQPGRARHAPDRTSLESIPGSGP